MAGGTGERCCFNVAGLAELTTLCMQEAVMMWRESSISHASFDARTELKLQHTKWNDC